MSQDKAVEIQVVSNTNVEEKMKEIRTVIHQNEGVLPGIAPESPHSGPEAELQRQMSKVLSIGQDERVVFAFDKIRYGVKLKDGTEKVILNSISGVVEPGEVCAVMGPSGSGKTTLLDFLADRIGTGSLSGQVLLNGAERNPKTFKHFAKYVPQEDHLVGTMTVAETLKFSADLSLGPEVSQEEREERINGMIQELGLAVCVDAKIGTVFQKGISGGQKRRVSMGVELLTLPKILFLDEPTSGLDSAAAFRVIDIAKRLASSGRAVVCTIHQPSSEVFHSIDKLMLLSGGNIVYFGSTEKVVDYFAELGFKCPPYVNPADFIMEVINADFESGGGQDVKSNVDKLIAHYKNSNEAKLVADRIDQLKSKAVGVKDMTPERSYQNNWFVQFITLARRFWLDNLRNPGIFWVRLLMYILLCLMIGTMYLNIGNGQTQVNDRIGILYYVAAFLVFMSISVIPAFISERAVFQRERANGWYSVSAYVAANTLTAIPGVFLIALMSSILVYFMVGLNSEEGRFGIFLADLFISLFVAESLMLVLSAIVPVYIIGMALGAGLFGMFMLCQGFYVLPENIPPYWIWGYYIGFHTYSFEVFMYNEFEGKTIKCDRPVGNTGLCQFNTGEDVLKLYDMDGANVGNDLAILVCMAIIYRIIFYFILQKFHRGRR